MRYVLGLDLGPSSIGWAAVTLDEKGNPCGIATLCNSDPKNRSAPPTIPAIGSRIFPAGIENINQGVREQPLNKDRREKRATRRRLRRARGRRRKLIALLRARGMLPASDEKLSELMKKDPYELRAKGLASQVGLEELGRIFMHFAKHRGFQSNRKHQDKAPDSGKVKQAILALKEQVGEQTLGQFYWSKLSQNPLEPVRNRRDDYRWIPQRDQLRDEMGRIWQKQQGFYQGVLTYQFYKELESLLFDQIPFELSNRAKRRIIGTCSLIKGQPRCSYENRKAQRFRMLQKVNDLLVTYGTRREDKLTPEERQKLVAELSCTKERTFDQIRKLLSLPEDAKFNLEYETNTKMLGNQIDAMMAGKLFGKNWHGLAEEKKEAAWRKCLDFLNDERMTVEQCAADIEKITGLKVKESAAIEKLEAPKGNLDFCEKAVDRILPYMEQGMQLYDAIEAAKFSKHFTAKDSLPLPTRDNGINITNPIVRSVLFELRKVVNALIRELGKPEKIVVELAREIKGNAETRQEIIDRQDENRAERQRAAEAIREHMNWDESVSVSVDDITKYRLWEEQNHLCPYSLRKISLSELLSRNTEIDHILPYSMSLDNSMANKVVCFANENQNKGQNTPVDGLAEPQWQRLEEAYRAGAFRFDKAKWERFCTHNAEIAEKYTPERLLRDTSYMARAVRDYLAMLYGSDKAPTAIGTTKGGITAELRNLWGLNAILRDGEVGPKNREDLRHHALDAAVVAVTSCGMIKNITAKLQSGWPNRPSRIRDIPEPWPGFGTDLAAALRQIVVSHRVQRRVRGALHKETNYHRETNGPHAGKFVTRKRLTALTPPMVDDICDESIRKLVKERLEAFGGNARKAFVEPLYLPNSNPAVNGGRPIPVKTVRIAVASNTMVQLDGARWVEPGSNHHVEIFRVKDKGKFENRLIRRIYTTWEVAQRVKEAANSEVTQKRLLVSRENPFPDQFKEVEFVISLSIGETVAMTDEKGSPLMARVVKMSPASDRPFAIDILFRECTAPNDKAGMDLRVTSMRNFEKLVKRKVTVDPLGRVRRAND
jgi:CRISPR-associated endonuclease Csn1